MTRSHFDISLKWVCENFAQRLMASFVMPTIGHFSTHDSDILQHTRDSEWDKWYVGEGKGKVGLMTWEKEGTRVVTKHLLDVNLQQEQPHHDWLTYFNESANPLVELVATSGQQYAHTPSRHGAYPQRTQVEMEHAFDVERMVGDEEALTRRQRRQRRRYVGDAAHCQFTQDWWKASGGRSISVQISEVLLRHTKACELVAHAWRVKNHTTPQHTHNLAQADSSGDHARPLTSTSSPEQFEQRGARLPMWQDLGASASSSSGYGPTSGYPARVQYLSSQEERRRGQQQHSGQPQAKMAPPGSIAAELSKGSKQ